MKGEFTFPLPADTRKILEKDERCENFILRFRRYLGVEKEGNTRNEKIIGDILKKLVKEELKDLSLPVLKRYAEAVNALKGEKVKMTLEVVEPLIVGAGSSGVLEGAELILYPLYGFPYIPASSLKGIMRTFCEELGDMKEEDIEEIFGGEGKRGKLVVMDGIPEDVKLGVDILTCHYSPYYTKNEPPGDWHKIMPVYFPVVSEGRFVSYLIFQEDCPLKEKLLEVAKNGMELLGIGAKTRSGYGRMKVTYEELTKSGGTNNEEGNL
ncbi:type III-B CRISPR module RAMP protein Cmr6 [bacterium]|nr:MAG: type III-B CRISPR module RAMP protein Cmr6 [bacterium]